ncbi:hypothetical protein [Singulisphaera acidiphila]|uniref:Uncharacterized protein n=1 Tax=Singulisphaera acidiphila (strain ATCC BAA-1392 / DSM 18658 / VKM B-2454 / MOB10) TaxID=886293 RepID=L0DHX9_SINAD|nr:hypothetical protein [Singulisphaera acidiphila]AGA28413.1 hypothetical protein Sinac_4209 [Singulisphaera acidiphila DSM 18658]
MKQSPLRKDVAFPRGRPMIAMAGSIITPLPSRLAQVAPGPALEYHSYFLVDGVPLHMIGERWLAEDAVHALTPTYPDPLQPGVELTTRLEDVDGTIIQAVSSEVYLACRQAFQAGSAARPVRRVSGQR